MSGNRFQVESAGLQVVNSVNQYYIVRDTKCQKIVCVRKARESAQTVADTLNTV